MRPRRAARSTKVSCSTPFSSTAARTSRGVTLIRISSPIGLSLRHRQGQQVDAGTGQQLSRFIQGQTHDAGIAALDPTHEQRAETLYGVAAGLVPGLAAGPVTRELSL